MLPRRRLLATLALAPLSAHAAEETPLTVVTSMSILADLVHEVGKAAVVVTSLVPPDGDAHTYEPKPSDLRALNAAQVLVENGLGLEGWMDRLRQASGFRGVRVVAAAGVMPRRFSENGRAAIDPHAWQDPRNGILYVRAIAEGLAQADPEHAGLWRARADGYAAEIAATDRWIAATLAKIPPEKRKIVTSHDAFGYYGARYGIELHFIAGLSTESEPSAQEVARLIADIRGEGIRAVFLENMTDPRLIATVARESGATIGPPVYSDALSPTGGPADTYLKMLRYNTLAFAAAMMTNG